MMITDRHRLKLIFILLLALIMWTIQNVNAAEICRISGPGIDKAYYSELIKEISRLLSPDFDILQDVRNWEDMSAYTSSETGGIHLAVCPSDIQLGYLQSKDHEEISNNVQQFRIVVPLLLEELHFVVRADSPMFFIHETANRKFFFGPSGSRAELTGESIYRLLFYREAPLKVQFPIFSAEEEYKAALNELLKGNLDVVMMIGAAPITSLLHFGINSPGKGFRLLQTDPDHLLSQKVLRIYPRISIPKNTYPWCSHDTTTLGVWTYLICMNDNNKKYSEAIRSLAETWCRKLSMTRGKFFHHNDFRQVAFSTEDWQFYPSISNFITRLPGGCF